jgi:hypothetical protein
MASIEGWYCGWVNAAASFEAALRALVQAGAFTLEPHADGERRT